MKNNSKSSGLKTITELIVLRPRKDGVSTYTKRNGKIYFRPDIETSTLLKASLKFIGKTWEDGASELVVNCMSMALAKGELKKGAA